MNTYDAAQDLAAHLRAVLPATVPTAVVTLDPDEAIAAVAAAAPTVLITPPRITYQTAHLAEAEWDLYVVGATSDRATSWQATDAVLAALLAEVNVTEARPYDWRPDDGPPLVTYQVTIHTDHDY